MRNLSLTELRAALQEFVDAVHATGGVTEEADGTFAPVADPDWIDVGEAYVKGCRVLGMEPLVEES